MTGVYVPGNSVLHRLPPAAKLAGLALFAVLLTLSGGTAVPLISAGLLLVAWAITELRWEELLRLLKPLLWFLVPIAVFQAIARDGTAAARITLNILDLVVAAGLVSATTSMNRLLESLTRMLRPLAAIGISPSLVAFSVGFVIRLVPVIAAEARDIDDARIARGARRNPLALLSPLLIRVIGLGNSLGEALDARGFGDNMRR